MSARRGQEHRKTRETDIVVELDLDGAGTSSIDTPLPFFSHMLEQIARHGGIDLLVRAQGDAEVDGHHTTEDVGLVFGAALGSALGDRRGIQRYGCATLPMDDALVTAAFDLSGRSYLNFAVSLPKAQVGDWDVELAEVFFEAVARAARANVHLMLHAGSNLHHIVEICFKAFARALREAAELDPRAQDQAPTTKGTLR